jgi:hypothetical protein
MVDIDALKKIGQANPLEREIGVRPRPPVSHSRELDRVLAIPRHPGYMPEDRAALQRALARPTCAMTLKELQADALLGALEGSQDGCGLFGALPVGSGKCLGPDVPVLLYNGKIIRACDVVTGDLLMGPDSLPRRVLRTSTGYGPMYRIIPVKGDSWTCNDVHVLTIVQSTTDIVEDIALDMFLEKAKYWRKEAKLFQPHNGVDYPDIYGNRLVDPYFLGVWLGDGTKALAGVSVSKPDPEIEQACVDEAARFGLKVRTQHNGTCPTYHIHAVPGSYNPLLHALRFVVRENLDAYFLGPRAVREQLLAGLLDTDGHLTTGVYEIVQKDPVLATKIAQLARSLGFRVTRREKYVSGQAYQRLHISGDVNRIPLRIPRKKAKPRKQKKDALRVGFTSEPIGHGAYFGWTLDGDGRFLLGDFNVTHQSLIHIRRFRRRG